MTDNAQRWLMKKDGRFLTWNPVLAQRTDMYEVEAPVRPPVFVTDDKQLPPPVVLEAAAQPEAPEEPEAPEAPKPEVKKEEVVLTPPEEPEEKPLEKMTNLELTVYARKNFGEELKPRTRKDKLLERIKELQNESDDAGE